MGVGSECGCKEVHRFPHTTYPYSSCIYLFFFAAASLLLFILKMFFVYIIIYRISSNSSRPPNRPRPRIDRVRRLEASEIQRTLELSAQYIINA